MLYAKLNSTASAFSSSSVICFRRSSERVRARSSFRSMGLHRKSSAPALIPLMRSSVAVRPVISTTGVSRVSGALLMRRHTSKPSIPGIMMSRRIKSGRKVAHSAMAVRPSGASRTSKPSRRSRNSSAARAPISSSTIRIFSRMNEGQGSGSYPRGSAIELVRGWWYVVARQGKPKVVRNREHSVNQWTLQLKHSKAVFDNLGLARCLIANLIRFLLPGAKGGQSLLAHHLDHGDFAVAVIELDLAVDESVVEATFRGVGGLIGEENANGASPVNSAKTHWARLATGVDFAAGQFENPQIFAGGADGHHFGMGGGVILGGYRVHAFGNDFSVMHDDSGEGPSAHTRIFDRKLDGTSHKGVGHEFVFPGLARAGGHRIPRLKTSDRSRASNFPEPENPWSRRIFPFDARNRAKRCRSESTQR